MRGERHVRLWTRSSSVGVPRLHRHLSLLLGEHAKGKEGDMRCSIYVEPTATVVFLYWQHLEGAGLQEPSASTHQHSAAKCATTEPSSSVFRTLGPLAVGIDSDGGGGRLE